MSPAPAEPPRFLQVLQARWWRRTRIGLLLSAVGLLVLWAPYASIAGALFLSLGSSFMFLGARAPGSSHRLAVVASLLTFAFGGAVIVTMFAAFALAAYNAARGGVAMSSLRDATRLLLWGSVPGTLLVVAAIALQVNRLLSPRLRSVLFGLAALLAVSVIAATWLAEPELQTLGALPVRTGPVLDFLGRLSLYRLLEAPAYVCLGLLYLAAHRATGSSLQGYRRPFPRHLRRDCLSETVRPPHVLRRTNSIWFSDLISAPPRS